MKSPILLWKWLAVETADLCGTSASRDIGTVASRVEAEGISFLTITLPDFCKAFEKALADGQCEPSLFPSFGSKGSLPKFLSGYTSQVFDIHSGAILDDPSIEAIRSVRQLTNAFGKILLPCTPERELRAIEGFVSCELEMERQNDRIRQVVLSPQSLTRAELDRYGDRGRYYRQRSGCHKLATQSSGTSIPYRPWSGTVSGQSCPDCWTWLLVDLSRVFDTLFGRALSAMDKRYWDDNPDSFVPRHGPGATADRLVGNNKYNLQCWTDRLQAAFPAEGFLSASLTDHAAGAIHFYEPGEEPPVKVTLVPKTLKTPRIIAIEPTHMQYVQQATLSEILRQVDQDPILTALMGTSYVTLFNERMTGQEANQLLAKRGSQDGSLATVDLSEASDRVSNELVNHLFKSREYITACRSSRAHLPILDRTIVLEKYASMGSALTFPIESMIFLSIVFLSIEQSLLTAPLTRRDVKEYVGRVRVFGDDIIIPSDCVKQLISNLEAFGFKVNESKSFWTGRFRESCGKEYYAGEDVSLIRMRNVLPTSTADAEKVASVVSLRNQLYMAGYWRTAGRLDDKVRLVLNHFPIGESTSPLLVRRSVSFSAVAERICPHLHVPLIKGHRMLVRPPLNAINGRAALLKWFIEGPQQDPNHLQRSGRSGSARIITGWATPY